VTQFVQYKTYIPASCNVKMSKVMVHFTFYVVIWVWSATLHSKWSSQY